MSPLEIICFACSSSSLPAQIRSVQLVKLAAAAREADSTRLISAACLINRETLRIEDRLAKHLDVIGINVYFGAYEPDFSGLERLLANSATGKP